MRTLSTGPESFPITRRCKSSPSLATSMLRKPRSSAQRTMIQRTHERVRRIELELGVAPSHYESAAPDPALPPTEEPRAYTEANP